MIRKSLTATAAAAIILGTVWSPTAMAASKASYTTAKKAIYLNGNLVSQPIGLTAKDPNTHRPTTYMPIWYVLQALKSVGVQYTWNGRDLNIVPAKGMTVTLTNLHPGNEDTRLYINGTLVDTAYRIVAKDPYSHVYTTYIPIWYVQYVLKHMGVVSTWDGTNWNLTVQLNVDVVQKLSISAAAQTVGTGQPDQLTVVATYSDGTTVTPPPSEVKWSTNDSADAFITPSQQFLATKPGSYTLTASFGGVTQTIQIQVYGGTSAIQLKANGDLVANGSSTQKVTVTAVDAQGLPAQNENGTVVVSADQPWIVTGTNANGQNTLGQSVAVQLKNGVGTLDIQGPSAPGVAVHLTASNLSDVQSGANIQYGSLSMTSVQQVATSLSITPVNGQKYLVANQAGNTASFDVAVNDQTGQPMKTGSYPYNISVSGSAAYTGPSTGVYVGGQTQPRITIQSEQGVTGPATVTVSANGLASASATVQALIAQVASKIVANPSGSSNSFAEGQSITYNLSAVDSNGAPTSFPTTPLTVYATNGQGQPAVNIRVNGAAETANGVALGGNQSITLSDTNQGADAGSYTVSIRDASGREWGSFQVAETPADAQKLTLSSSTSEVAVANPSTTVTLQYTDTYGNPTAAPAGVGPLTITASGGQGGATINGQDATQGVKLTPDANGKVTANFSAQPYAGSVWKLTARDGKLTSNTISVAVMNALVTQATVSLKDLTTGSTTQATAGDSLQVTFGALDSYNNPYYGNDQFAVTFPIGALSGVSGGTSNNGVTSVIGTQSQLASDFSHARAANAQTLTVQIADQSVSTAKAGSASITVLPGQFAGFAVFNGQNQLISSANPIQISTNTATEVWVRPVDALNNPVPVTTAVYAVDLSDNLGTGSFRLSPSGSDIKQLAFPMGVSSEPVYYVNASRTYVLTASLSIVDPSHSSVTVSSFTPYRSNPATYGTGTLTVVLKDGKGLPVTGQESNLTASASASGVTVGKFTESSTTAGTYTAIVTSTENHTGVTITVKDSGTTVGTSKSFNS